MYIKKHKSYCILSYNISNESVFLGQKYQGYDIYMTF